MTNIITRAVPDGPYATLSSAGLHPVLARILAARGVQSERQLANSFAGLLPPGTLKGVREAATLLADAVQARQRLLIVADYDADGATACAVGIRALRAFGASVDYLVPNRFEYGYGLTPEIVQLAAQRSPDLLITVDNGIASIEGVAEANRLGMRVIVTDHHLPAEALPAAAAIVNPNQSGCDFRSKHLAGVGVIFYVMVALRAELESRNHFAVGAKPKLADLLDIVALGTVADVVRLDENNRILVAQGINRIRAGHAHAGIKALLRVSGREAARVTTYDLGFVLGPRLNAAGRLDDMALGIECLITDDEVRATAAATQLDQLNRERREIQADMQETAFAKLERFDPRDNYSLVVFEPDWHPGVVGLVAAKLKDRFHRPTIVFARGKDGELKGSGRSIASLHLRDALDLVAKRHANLIGKFGGHAAAAGLTIAEIDLRQFSDAFEQVSRSLLSLADLAHVVETDGELAANEATVAVALCLQEGVWGKDFPAPLFHGEFDVISQRIVAEMHVKSILRNNSQEYDSIQFFTTAPLPERIRTTYRLDLNEYNGSRALQLVLEYWEAA
jgi:single-stranded-DNA-specific exonuclease